MFEQIAPSYDRLNHLLSLNIDQRWRRLAVRHLLDRIEQPGALALDLCCGTADLTIELARHTRAIGCDFCHPMLVLGNEKLAGARGRATLTEGDALHLPFAEAQFDAVTIAFGLRNLARVEGGLEEIFRVLKPGGRVAILEFSRPVVPIFRPLFQFYFHQILPRIGGLISGSSEAYRYLPQSVRHFPDQSTLAAMMRSTGFIDVRYRNLSAGIAALHLGDRPALKTNGEERPSAANISASIGLGDKAP